MTDNVTPFTVVQGEKEETMKPRILNITTEDGDYEFVGFPMATADLFYVVDADANMVFMTPTTRLLAVVTYAQPA